MNPRDIQRIYEKIDALDKRISYILEEMHEWRNASDEKLISLIYDVNVLRNIARSPLVVNKEGEPPKIKAKPKAKK